MFNVYTTNNINSTHKKNNISSSFFNYHIKNTIWVSEEPAQLAFTVVEDHRIHHPVFINNFADVRRDHYHYLKVWSLKIHMYIIYWYLFPSIQPGNGSLQVLSMTLGLMVTTGISPRMELMTISPMALVNT